MSEHTEKGPTEHPGSWCQYPDLLLTHEEDVECQLPREPCLGRERTTEQLVVSEFPVEDRYLELACLKGTSSYLLSLTLRTLNGLTSVTKVTWSKCLSFGGTLKKVRVSHQVLGRRSRNGPSKNFYVLGSGVGLEDLT